MISALEIYKVFVMSGVIYTQGTNIALHFFQSKKKDLYNSWSIFNQSSIKCYFNLECEHSRKNLTENGDNISLDCL